jgi:hypothetical protein
VKAPGEVYAARRPGTAARPRLGRRAAWLVGAVAAFAAFGGLAADRSVAAGGAGPVELRAFVDDRCIVADEPWYRPDAADGTVDRSLTLLGIVATKLAGVFMQQAVDAAASRLQARAARQDTRYAVARQASLYVADLSPAPVVHLNGRLGCLTIVAGEFEPGDPDCRARYVPRTVAAGAGELPLAQWRTDRSDDSLENVLRRTNVCLARARAVYEARFEFSEDGTAWRLRNAGYRIDRLLTTDRDDAERSLFYTLDVRAPGRTKDPELLSTAWIDLGRVKAGARDTGSSGPELPWLRVPPLSEAARRFYDETTAVHQETAAQVQALQRAIARNESVRTTLEQRRRKASGALAQSLRAEVVRVQTQGLTLQAELEARRVEYAGLRQESLDLMPVSIEVGVTETSSERKALRALAVVIQGNRDFIASTMVGAASGLVARRSLDAPPPLPRTSMASELDQAREAYHDALVESRHGEHAESAAARAAIDAARLRYESARQSAGLSPATTRMDNDR